HSRMPRAPTVTVQAFKPKGGPDTTHVAVTTWESTGASSDSPAKGTPSPKRPPVPRTIHLLLVPDAAKTWIVQAADIDLAVAKARALSGPADASLATRAGLENLRAARASWGGFMTARSLVSSSPARYLSLVPFGKAHEGRSLRRFDELGGLAMRSAAPLLF